MDKDRAKKLDTVFDQIEKQFGEGSLMRLGADNIKKIPAISTGALSIDLALGIGGVQKVELLKFMDLKLQVKLPYLYMLQLKHKKQAV